MKFFKGFSVCIRRRQMLEYCNGPIYSFLPSWSPEGAFAGLLAERGQGLEFVGVRAEDLLGEKDDLYDSNLEKAAVLYSDGNLVDKSAWNPRNMRVSAGIAESSGGYTIKELGNLDEPEIELPVVGRRTSAQPSFSPDGGRMVFATEWPPTDNPRKCFELQMMNCENGEIGKFLSRQGQCLWQPQWSPDGSRIAYVSYMGPKKGSRVEVIDLETGKERVVRPLRLWPGVLCQENPTWGAGGRCLAFIEYYAGSRLSPNVDGNSVVIADMNTGKSVDLKQQEDGKGIVGDLAWRPGTSTLLCRVEDGLVALHLEMTGLG